jgi:WD40 repeat protein
MFKTILSLLFIMISIIGCGGQPEVKDTMRAKYTIDVDKEFNSINTYELNSKVGKPFVQAGHTSVIDIIKTSADGKYAFTAGGDLGIKLWDLTTKRTVKTFKGHSGIGIQNLVVSKNNKYMASVTNKEWLCRR